MVDSVVCFVKTCPLRTYSYSGGVIYSLNNWALSHRKKSDFTLKAADYYRKNSSQF